MMNKISKSFIIAGISCILAMFYYLFVLRSKPLDSEKPKFHQNNKIDQENLTLPESVKLAEQQLNSEYEQTNLSQLTFKEQADRFKKLRDAKSLKLLSQTIVKGTSRLEIENSLGLADQIAQNDLIYSAQDTDGKVTKMRLFFDEQSQLLTEIHLE